MEGVPSFFEAEPHGWGFFVSRRDAHVGFFENIAHEVFPHHEDYESLLHCDGVFGEGHGFALVCGGLLSSEEVGVVNGKEFVSKVPSSS